MPAVSQLFIYPIKSLGGIAVASAIVTDRGFQYDRRWMLVDSDNCFMTQRDFPEMALLQVCLADAGLRVQHKIKRSETVHVPETPQINEIATVQIWEDQCKAVFVGKEFDEWFSDMLSFKCRLVYMPDSSLRRVDMQYAFNTELTSFSDGYPFLIIGQSSLDDLNARLAEPLPIDRFRPNIVFTGAEPFAEDRMEHFSINNIQFYGVKLCARCAITTVDQDSAVRLKEPLKTLAAYRQWNNNIYFGQNLLHQGTGEIKIDDIMAIHRVKQAIL
jgi:MOSC domain-containing protein